MKVTPERAKYMKQGSCGVWPLLLPDVHPFNPACFIHDCDYETHDWHETTEAIDLKFYNNCMDIAEHSPLLQAEAKTCYRIVRAWGTMRYYLAKIGVNWANKGCSYRG